MAVKWSVAAGIVLAGLLAAMANVVPWPLAAMLGLAAGALTLAGMVGLGRRGDEVDLAALAATIRTQWKAELQSRGVSLSTPMAVRWAVTDRPVSAPAADIVGAAVGGRPVRVRAAGDLHDLADRSRELPRRQLVILGEAGAGKTVLAVFLALDLLTGDVPVPVVLPLSTWDPERSLYDWAADQLGREYPKVASPQAWRRLLASGDVLPILDGLDEVPDTHRVRALREVNTATDGGNPFVLTCRSDEYENLVQEAGSRLTSALVVELSPVTPEQVVAYLRRPGQDGRWEQVFAAVRAGGPLAEVLSVPFMTSLARFAYATPDTDPAALCALPDEQTIRAHLLAAFLPAAYSPCPHPDLGHTNRPAYTAADATAWLSFLARHMTRLGMVDFAWWRLHEMLSPRQRIRLRLRLPGASFGALAGCTIGNFVMAGVVWLTLSALCGLLIGLMLPIRPRRPVWVDPAVDRNALRLRRWTFGVTFAVTTAGVAAVAAYFWSRVAAQAKDSLSGWQVALVIALFALLVASLVGSLLGWAVYAVRARPSRGGVTLPTVKASLVADREFLFRNGLPYYLLAMAIVVVADVLGNSGPYLFIAAGVGYSLRAWHASRSFDISNRLLRKRLPHQLLPFLEDAHKRGILRQAGMVYQFRHGLLQDHLSGKAP